MNDPIVDAVLVDTDVFSYLMSGKNYARLYHPHLEGKLMAISFITVGELYFGAYKKKWGPERLENLKDRLRSVTIVPYDEGVCKRYAEIKAAVESKGKAVSDNDLWIAACSIRHAIPLITNNRRHFDEVPGLVVISESQAMREMQSQMSIPAEVTPEPGAPSQPPSKSPAGVEKPVTPRSRNRS